MKLTQSRNLCEKKLNNFNSLEKKTWQQPENKFSKKKKSTLYLQPLFVLVNGVYKLITR